MTPKLTESQSQTLKVHLLPAAQLAAGLQVAFNSYWQLPVGYGGSCEPLYIIMNLRQLCCQLILAVKLGSLER